MATCKECLHYEVCSGFTPTDLDRDVFDYCRKGITEEIPDIEKRCSDFKNAADVVEVVRCKDCEHYDEGGCKHFGYHTYSPDVDEDDFCSYGRTN